MPSDYDQASLGSSGLRVNLKEAFQLTNSKPGLRKSKSGSD